MRGRAHRDRRNGPRERVDLDFSRRPGGGRGRPVCADSASNEAAPASAGATTAKKGLPCAFIMMPMPT
ncbi:hypothetical protein E2E30_07740 [Sphingomonas sp. AAP5]|nr:hypothetical protein E2E30_07740 [Sphingomonas sp. AAP5]